VSDADALKVASYVDNGGTLLVGPYSGVVDENDHIRLGGYGAWRDLTGVHVEEFFPLESGGQVALSNGASGRVWTELATAVDAEVLVSYSDGPLAGAPALTRRSHGAGTAYYLTTHLDDAEVRALLVRVAGAAGVAPILADPPPGVEAVQRRHPDGRTYTFLTNDSDAEVRVADTPIPPHTMTILGP
jgi:beta-galactosidase